MSMAFVCLFSDIFAFGKRPHHSCNRKWIHVQAQVLLSQFLPNLFYKLYKIVHLTPTTMLVLLRLKTFELNLILSRRIIKDRVCVIKRKMITHKLYWHSWENVENAINRNTTISLCSFLLYYDINKWVTWKGNIFEATGSHIGPGILTSSR